MNAELKAVIDRVAKLRALATSSEQHEAEAAAAIAEKLIQTHRLSEADLGTTDDPGEVLAEDPEGLFVFATQLPTWQWFLCSGLGHLYGVAFWVDRCKIKSDVYPYFKHGHTLKMVGRASDIEILRYQYAFLVLEIDRLAQRFGDQNRFAKGQARTMMNSFRLGAVNGVITAMRIANRETMKASKASGSGAAMVLANRRELAEQEKKRLHPHLVSRGGGGGMRVNGDAYAEGRTAGGSIHRGGALPGAGAGRMLGTGK